MIPGHIHGATRQLGKPDNMTDEQCVPLAIKDTRIDGCNVMVSAWFPSPDEVRKMMAGQPVHLYVWGTGHPPVGLEVPEL